ncbi:MAG: hypothetical protein AAGH88_14505 [Planctomycetota bacterium]
MERPLPEREDKLKEQYGETMKVLKETMLDESRRIGGLGPGVAELFQETLASMMGGAETQEVPIWLEPFRL